MARIVVAGTGAIGAFLAHSLAKRGARDVVLCDRGKLIGGSTGNAMGGVRQQFSTAIEVKLAQASVAFFEELGDPLFQQNGYLFVSGSDAEFEKLRERVKGQRALGVPVEIVDKRRIASIAPGVRTDDLTGGAFCAKDGLADPPGITREVLNRATALGVDVREFHDARQVKADILVIAAGAYSAELAASRGIELPIRPLVRQLFETVKVAGLPPRLPMVVESETGFHFRPRGECLRVAMGDPAPRWQFHAEVDSSVLPDRLARLTHRFPAAAGATVERAWAGLYDMTPDAHPILDKIDDATFVACGFSGHGFMQSPAVGELMAAWVLDGVRDETLAPFALARFRGASSFGETVIL